MHALLQISLKAMICAKTFSCINSGVTLKNSHLNLVNKKPNPSVCVYEPWPTGSFFSSSYSGGEGKGNNIDYIKPTR